MMRKETEDKRSPGTLTCNIFPFLWCETHTRMNRYQCDGCICLMGWNKLKDRYPSTDTVTVSLLSLPSLPPPEEHILAKPMSLGVLVGLFVSGHSFSNQTFKIGFFGSYRAPEMACKPVIPTLQRLKEEDCLSYIVRCLS